MASPEAAAELNRQYSQNRNDIVDIHELLTATNETVKDTRVRVGRLDTKVNHLTTRVSGLDTKVGHLTTRVSGLDTKVDHLTTRMSRLDQIDTKVDNLAITVGEMGKTLQSVEREMSTMSTSHRQHDNRMVEIQGTLDLHTGRVDRVEEVQRQQSERLESMDNKLGSHDARFDDHDRRFDALGGQMAEVLGILRGTGK